jgi:hypothetical protein
MYNKARLVSYKGLGLLESRDNNEYDSFHGANRYIYTILRKRYPSKTEIEVEGNEGNNPKENKERA